MHLFPGHKLRFRRRRSALPTLSAHRASRRAHTNGRVASWIERAQLRLGDYTEIGSFADDRLGFETLYDDTFVVLAGAQNSWVRRRSIDLADLVNESWVLPPPESALASI